MVLMIQAVKQWYCPNCPTTAVTNEARPHTQFHPCPGLRGITAPLIEVGTKAKVEAKLREDYVGKDLAQLDEDGRAVMSVITTRDDGQDVAVLASTATARAE